MPNFPPNPSTPSPAPDRPLAEDLLFGAAAIAEFIYGDKRKRRQVYHLVQSGSLPVFKMGNQVCARKSTVLLWVEEMEGRKGVDCRTN